jgi:hypothetical protein
MPKPKPKPMLMQAKPGHPGVTGLFLHRIWGPPIVQFLRRTGRNCLSMATARVREVSHVRNCLYDYVIYERGYVFSSQNQAFSGMEMDTVTIQKKMWWLRKRLSVLSRWSMDFTA